MLSQAVDDASASNFQIAGMTVVAATLNEAKDNVILTVNGAEPETNYTLIASGLQIGAEVQKDVNFNFTMPAIVDLFRPAMEADVEFLKADGASSALVTFSLKDAEGKIVTDAEDVEVAFTATFGNFAEQRVAVQNGVATVQYTSEFLTKDQYANLQAQIVEAADVDLINLKAELNLLLTPNPEAIEDETIGASMTDAEANQADRIIAYFNKEVNVADYVTSGTFAVDSGKAEITVKTKSTTKGGGTGVDVVGLLPVQGNSKALQIMLDVEAGAYLVDNADVYIEFIDKSGSVNVARETTFKLTDTRKPSMLNVTREGLKKIKVIFSEPIENTSATAKANWSINGKLLNSTTWNGTATVGAFNPATGEDLRHIVTIELGDDTAGNQIYFQPGTHSVQAANIGDWAFKVDNANIMNTQTLDFIIPADIDAPEASVEVQSPEQWVLKFNKNISENTAALAGKIKLQKYNVTTSAWEDVGNMVTTATPNNTTLDILIASVADNEFILETDYDWTKVYDTATTKKNYYNDSYRLHVPANAVTNVANGKKNAEQNLTLGGAMLTPDTTSPTIAKIVEKGAGISTVTMSEPVKLNATANSEGITLAQNQSALPVPTAEFIKSDLSKTIPGTVAASFADDYDKELTVTPAVALEAGDWTLVIRSISDDVGNTAPSATKEFTVAGSVPVDTDFEVLWAFADVDDDLVVEDTDAADGDSNYDYVYIKFSKAIATTGDFKNVLKTANYTLNGVNLPNGSQILTDIKGYDDLDNVYDSVTIRLPQNTLNGINAPHILNISRHLESMDSNLLNNPGEKTLAFNNSALFAGIAAEVAAYEKLVDTQDAAADILSDGFDAGEVSAFETAYNTAAAAIDALDDASLVKAQYQAVIDDLKAAVKAHEDFEFAVSVKTTPNVSAKIAGIDEVTDFSAILWDGTTPRYEVTITDDDGYGTDVTFTAATGAVSLTNDKGNDDDAEYTQTIKISDAFWGVSDTVTVTIKDESGNDTLVVNND
ncbi:hypothetical protein [Desulfotomaculum sp. 1211_IL3151]|uniref:hypothetical protein n=1 Tax=Desulfotomaculum sp. 1211_IL3151 TaxID=3084055 RepID=UPI002FDA71AC